MMRCLAPDCQMGGLGCDNMTVVLVCFVNGESYEKLAERCKLAPLSLSQAGASNLDYAGNGNTNGNYYNQNMQSITSLTSGIQLKSSTNDDANWARSRWPRRGRQSEEDVRKANLKDERIAVCVSVCVCERDSEWVGVLRRGKRAIEFNIYMYINIYLKWNKKNNKKHYIYIYWFNSSKPK